MKHFYLLMAFTFLKSGLICAQYQNVMLDNSFNPQETSVSISEINPDNIVAGSNLQNLYYSSNGGLTWSAGVINSSLGVYGDPCIVSDTAGDFYYFHLGGSLDKIICQKSTDGGITFSNGSFANNNNTKLHDKEWGHAARDGNVYVCWTEYDTGFNPGPQDSSRIFFSRSVNGGLSFSAPVQLNEISGDCLYLDITDAHPCAGPNGQVYVTFMDSAGIRINRSNDFGLTWLNSPPLIDSAGAYRYYNITGIYRIRAMPYNACDLSGGVHHGNIYLTWADNRNGFSNTDVFFSRSTDGGNTWSVATKLNSDAGSNHNYRPAMAVDQVTGTIYVVYHDRRNFAANDSVDIYMARSVDGGLTWSDFKISNSPYLPTGQFDGDYIDIAAFNGRVRPVWTRVDIFGTSIWTCLFDESATGIQGLVQSNDFSVNPNPAKTIAAVSAKRDLIHRQGFVKSTSGKVCMQFELDKNGAAILDVSSLLNGLYLVEVGGVTRKLVVMK